MKNWKKKKVAEDSRRNPKYNGAKDSFGEVEKRTYKPRSTGRPLRAWSAREISKEIATRRHRES